MCCACAYNTYRYIQESKESGLTEALSPEFTYGNRLPDENFEGMYMRSCLKKGREGSILFKELPNFTSTEKAIFDVNKNKENYLRKADNYKIDSFYLCNSGEEAKQAILKTGAVMIGIMLYNCFYNVKSDGIINYDPNKDINNYGGHAVLVVGWKNVNNKEYWICINSWGKDWGDNGYFYLPREYKWIDGAYAIIDAKTLLNFEDYKNKFYK